MKARMQLMLTPKQATQAQREAERDTITSELEFIAATKYVDAETIEPILIFNEMLNKWQVRIDLKYEGGKDPIRNWYLNRARPWLMNGRQPFKVSIHLCSHDTPASIYNCRTAVEAQYEEEEQV